MGSAQIRSTHKRTNMAIFADSLHFPLLLPWLIRYEPTMLATVLSALAAVSFWHAPWKSAFHTEVWKKGAAALKCQTFIQPLSQKKIIIIKNRHAYNLYTSVTFKMWQFCKLWKFIIRMQVNKILWQSVSRTFPKGYGSTKMRYIFCMEPSRFPYQIIPQATGTTCATLIDIWIMIGYALMI